MKLFRDRHGLVLPLGCHFGEGLSAFVRPTKRDLVLKQYDAIAAAGFHCTREWDNLGYYDLAWGGREVTPIAFKSKAGVTVQPTPGYYEKMHSWLIAHHERGLAVMHDRGDLNSWTNTQKFDHMRRVGEVYRALGAVGRDVLAGMWAVNEAAHNGIHDPKVAGDMLLAFAEGAGWLPDVCGLSDYDQTEELEMYRAWSASPATIITSHALRDPVNVKRMLEHNFTNGYAAARMLGKRMWATEPIGPNRGVSVGQEDRLNVLKALSVLRVLSGQADTYMSGFGVFWNGPLRVKGQRVTRALLESEGEQQALMMASQEWDFSQHQTGFLEIPRLIARLPKDVHTWKVIHSGTTFRGTRVYIANDHARSDGVIDEATGRFVFVNYGENGVPSLPVERNVAELEILEDGPWARILMGRVA